VLVLTLVVGVEDTAIGGRLLKVLADVGGLEAIGVG